MSASFYNISETSAFATFLDDGFFVFQIMISMVECTKFTSLNHVKTVHDSREVPEYYVTGDVNGQSGELNYNYN